jgi:thioredoxin-dependent peroxiredoxin
MKLLRVAALIAATPVLLAAQQQAAAPAMPEIGAVAPDFSIPAATRDGVSAQPVSLSALRGKTVVLAFFPAARTSGCTAQMQTYRDQYAELFNGGKDVVVIGISADADTTLANWAREAGFPFIFGSDAERTVMTAYGSISGRYAARNVFVIAPDGRVHSRMTRFNALSADAYTELGTLVKAAMKPAAGSDSR